MPAVVNCELGSSRINIDYQRRVVTPCMPNEQLRQQNEFCATKDTSISALQPMERKLEELEKQLELTNEQLRQQNEFSASKDTVMTTPQSTVAACRHSHFTHDAEMTEHPILTRELAFYRASNDAQQRELDERKEQQRKLKCDVAYSRDAFHTAQQHDLKALKECTKLDELSAAKDARVCALQAEVDALRGKMDQLRTLCAAH